MTNQSKIIVKAQSAGQRLDVFLSEKLKVSRSQVQKLIAEDGILLNDNLPKKSGEQIKKGDTVSILSSRATAERSLKVSERDFSTSLHSARNDSAQTDKINIVAETADYLVVEKPVGLLTHPTMKNETNALSSMLVAQYPELKKVGDDPMRPGIVHRLDKDASGLLVVARTQKMFDHLKEQFKTRKIEKEYLALAHGKVAKDWDEIDFPIARGQNAERMAAIPIRFRGEKTESGKEALTEFLVEKRYVNFTLLRVKIHTGRMHQIRVHLLAYNHPLVGDPLYFQKKRKKMWDEKLGRMFLHCTKLGFTDLEGNVQTFNSTIPKQLTEFLKILK